MKEKNIQLVVFDLDGTLLNDRKEISNNSKHAIEELSKRDIKICLASGRHSSMMDIYSRQLTQCDYLISSNGSVLLDNVKNETIHGFFLDPNEAKNIVESCIINKLEFVVYKDTEIYFTDWSYFIKKRFENYENLQAKYKVTVGIERMTLSNLQNFQRIEKIAVYQIGEKEMRFLEDILDRLFLTKLENTGDRLFSFVHSSASKGEALKRLFLEAGLSSESTMVFGDYDNDISLFEAASIRVAMKNSTQSIIDLATFITDTNNNDGVAKAIKHILIPEFMIN